MRFILGIIASAILLFSVLFPATSVFSADYTVPPKKTEPKMPAHAKANMQYKLSMKNKYMKVKATTGIQIDLPDTKKSNEKTKIKTPYGVKFLTKSVGNKNKQVGVKTNQLPKQ